ncbi:MAG: trypsin-like peptidase domain-containing protein [Longispora sp.]|nr:trypsin-like peptidase domain-containing protein [Longispora sp. (in: high G+C Gram-positive bacteria)]
MGDQLIVSDDTLDFSLFSGKNFDNIRGSGYLELDERKPEKGEEIYIPQHPSGEVKELGITSDQECGANCKVDDPTYGGYAAASDVSYFCDTAGGSSGSPVLSRKTHKVIALHHFDG